MVGKGEEGGAARENPSLGTRDRHVLTMSPAREMEARSYLSSPKKMLAMVPQLQLSGSESSDGQPAAKKPKVEEELSKDG